MARPTSDVDVGVLLAAATTSSLGVLDAVFDLQSDLEELFGRTVDVVSMDGAPVDLVHRILRDGVLVQDADPRRRIEFELNARNGYFDLLPILERYRRTLIDSA